jgi:hypothetical protein
MSDSHDSTPQLRIDENKPSVARAYDAFLDGKDNFEVDRHLVEKFLEVMPDAKAMARENRRWLIRAVRWLADTAGVDQFLDCGSGLPTQENTHDVVQRVNPDARVVYVDSDPICAAHGRAMLEENDRTCFVHADLTEVESLFEHPTVRQHLDLERPVALIHCSTIHHVTDEQQPYDIMQRYIKGLAGGSYVALTHFWECDEPRLTSMARALENVLQEQQLGTGFWRTRTQIQSYFDGLQMVEPGLVELHDWWPTGPRRGELADHHRLLLGGVGRKP